MFSTREVVEMIPLMHDFSGETVLVFGGGSVGARKARRFAREARVVVVAPEFTEDDYGERVAQEGHGGNESEQDSGSVERVRSAPAPDEVADWVERTGPVLVVAATDNSEVNEAAEVAAREQGALVNRADQSGGREAGSVVVPATVRDDPVTVAVSTGGTSPALSRYLRQQIEDEIAGAGAMAELTAKLRAELKAEGVPPEERRNALRAVVRNPDVWKGLRTGDTNGRQEAERVIRNERGDLT